MIRRRFSDRYIALYVPTSDFFSSSRKWQIRLEIFKKVGFFRLFVAIVPEESRKSEKPTSENLPIVTGLSSFYSKEK